MHAGSVSQWDDDAGWGVIQAPETPGGCWTHFSAIHVLGYRVLCSGDEVWFVFEPVAQDGYDYRAVSVWPPSVTPGTPDPNGPTAQTSAYWSVLVVSLDEESEAPPAN